MAASCCPVGADSFGKTDVTKLLLARGARINATTDDGHTPLDMALQAKDSAVIELLRGQGAVEGSPFPMCEPRHRRASR
jgi:ankyrin repeat protein